jgi:YD repeat-containing protein
MAGFWPKADAGKPTCGAIDSSANNNASSQQSGAEQGIVSYTYDGNGNALTRTDARSAVTTMIYDGLNRVTTRSYSGGTGVASTPNVGYCYDAQPGSDQSCPTTAQSGYKGRLTQSKTTNSATQYTSFDDLGRVKQSKQITAGTPYPFTYAYDLTGNLTSMTLPTNRQINYTYDDLSRVGSVISIVNGVPQTIASTFSYTPHGAATSMTLGNSLVEQRGYNPRLQMSSLNAGGLLTLGYDYGSSSHVNNGNLYTQTIGGSLSASQNYRYDGVNRLTVAAEGGSLPTSCPASGVTWCENYGYDPYGNRWMSTVTGLTVASSTPSAADW